LQKYENNWLYKYNKVEIKNILPSGDVVTIQHTLTFLNKNLQKLTRPG